MGTRQESSGFAARRPRRASQLADGNSPKGRIRDEARLSRGRSPFDRPRLEARSAGSKRPPGRLFFGSFLLATQKKGPRPRCENRNQITSRSDTCNHTSTDAPPSSAHPMRAADSRRKREKNVAERRIRNPIPADVFVMAKRFGLPFPKCAKQRKKLRLRSAIGIAIFQKIGPFLYCYLEQNGHHASPQPIIRDDLAARSERRSATEAESNLPLWMSVPKANFYNRSRN